MTLAALCCGGRAVASETVTRVAGVVRGDTAVKQIVIFADGAHPSVQKSITVPVGADGKFEYELCASEVGAYQLTPNLSAFDRKGKFFSEGGRIDFDITVNPVDRYDFEIGSTTDMPLTRSLQGLYSSEVADPEYVALMAFQDSIYDHEPVSEADKQEVSRRYDVLGKRLGEEKLRFIAADRTVCGLYLIVERLWYPQYTDQAEYLKLYEAHYKGSFDGHTYVSQIESAIPVYRGEGIAVGHRYPDVTASDSDGNAVALSSLISGKVALIDLWASWCGPCRRNSKALIPVYEKFHPKGFEIVGIARELDNDKAMRRAMATDGYPWTSLVEINDANNIWMRFGTPNAPGRTVLVDRDGAVLAIDPAVEEIERILDKKF